MSEKPTTLLTCLKCGNETVECAHCADLQQELDKAKEENEELRKQICDYLGQIDMLQKGRTR